MSSTTLSFQSPLRMLPDDAVLEIARFLPSDADRLRLALTAKSLCAAVPPRPTDVSLKTKTRIASLCQALRRHPSFSNCLLVLEVHFATKQADVKAALPLIRDIFTKARSLRRLTLGPQEYASPELRFLLRNFSSLTHLAINESKCSSLATASANLPHSLQSIHLSSCSNGTTWHALVKSLSVLPSLTALTLEDCSFEVDADDSADEDEDNSEGTGESGEEGDHDNNQDNVDTHEQQRQLHLEKTLGRSLSHLHTLHAILTPLPDSYLAFSKIFPQLDTLELVECALPADDNEDEADHDQSLKQLTLIDCDATACAPPPWTIHNGSIASSSMLYDSDTLLDDLCLCQPEVLTGLVLRIPVFMEEMWTNLTENASKLHRLELETYEMDLLSTITLLASIFEEQTDQEDDEEQPPIIMLSVAGSRYYSSSDLEEQLTGLLKHASNAFPELQYIAVASTTIKMFPFKDLSGEGAPWRWWRIPRGDRTDIREIPAWEGERVRRYFREADRAQAENFNGACKPTP
ncbi:hypothetical protein BN946_scf184747.g49 [Trametes cinnabarina]|uniref:F-box domain-containing protein n=1 Tax=Pycnoporus cinnabarinus TaxID=5643 RepID=A0A060SSV0_PYCCI|nr:hypothetical protein BN946_scf184747.g49 [Trametes cinnabarina]